MRTRALLALALVATSAAAPAAARTWSQDWAVGPHPVLHVSTHDARVRLHRGAPGKVSAVVEYSVDVWGFHSRIEPPRIEMSRAGDVITVVAREHPGVNVVFFGGVNERFHVDVTVPPACDVQVRTGDGSIDAEPLTGALDLETRDGHIRVHGLSGRLRLATGDGGVDADSLDGALDAHTGDGHLRVAGRFDELSLQTGDGRVQAVIARGSQPVQPWEVRTGDGSVTLKIPRDLRALLDVTSGDGPLHVNLPIDRGEIVRHALRGQLNGGTLPLRVHTGDGPVTLGLSEE